MINAVDGPPGWTCDVPMFKRISPQLDVLEEDDPLVSTPY